MDKKRKLQIFCDFDGTITKKDTLNSFFRTYADTKWLEVEADWRNGKIGSAECIIKQMQLLRDIDTDTVDKFLKNIEIDEYFPEFLEFIKENDIDFCIVSDGFDYFIRNILESKNISGIKIFANHFNPSTFAVDFPYSFSGCKASAGVCKCNVVKQNKKEKNIIVYIGDGISDICASKYAGLLFAKGSLLEYCKENKSMYKFCNLMDFKNFSDITGSIKIYSDRY